MSHLGPEKGARKGAERTAHLPGGLQNLHGARNQDGGPVRCSAWLAAYVPLGKRRASYSLYSHSNSSGFLFSPAKKYASADLPIAHVPAAAIAAFAGGKNEAKKAAMI